MSAVFDSDGCTAMHGELDMATVLALEAWLTQLDGQPLDVDLSGVTFFDSSALRTFLVAHKRNPNLRIVNPSTAVKKVLEITGTFDYLVRDSEVGQ